MNIDSTNMRPSDWMRIRDVIVEGYADHDGFVILHGTDTMSYTAAALSYLIQDSPKPIVLTGSQKPMGNPFTDAKLNLYQSLLYALDEHSHDVSIVFGGVAIAGTRARKQRTVTLTRSLASTIRPSPISATSASCATGFTAHIRAKTRCVSTTASTRAYLYSSSRPA